MRIGIIAALPGELKPLVAGWQRLPVARGSGLAMWQQEQGADSLIAACAGMGSAAARRAFTAAEHAGSLDEVVSVGWAGALDAEAEPGQAYRVFEIVDAQTGERFSVADAGAAARRLVTTAHVAQQSEKRRLAATYDAGLVDMEAATIARLAQIRDIPMHCFKAVSDGVEANLPDLNRFIDISGKLQLSRFLGHVSTRPRFWPGLIEIGRNSRAAAENLSEMVDRFLLREGA